MVVPKFIPLIVFICVLSYSNGIDPVFLDESGEFIIRESPENKLSGWEDVLTWQSIKVVNELKVFADEYKLFIPSNLKVFLKTDIIGDKRLHSSDHYSDIAKYGANGGLRDRYHVLASYVESNCWKIGNIDEEYSEVQNNCAPKSDGTARVSYCHIIRHRATMCPPDYESCSQITTASCTLPAL